ncbi:MAG: tetratricopeptide repeat protein [Pseudomonadota bacterium]
MRRQAWLLAFLLVGPTGALAQGRVPEKAQTEVTRLSERISALEAEVKAIHVEGYIFNPEERYLDAQVSFDLSHWNEAATQLFSLAEDPRFKADGRYFEALRMLAVSLFEMGNLEGARDYFEKLVETNAEAGEALVYLVEIASKLGQTEDLRRYTAQVAKLSNQVGSDRLNYAYGKALYLTGEYADGFDALQRIAVGSPLYVKARYIAAAILVAQNRLDEAETAFEEVVSRGDKEADARIIELANLSIARIAYETGLLSKAADYYQRIPRKSVNFQRALYEMTHLHIKASGQFEDPDKRFASLRKALETLEILSGAPDISAKLSIETAILRGRINMLLGMLNYAAEGYKEVVDRFAPMSTELWEFSQDEARIGRWFESIVHEQVDPIGRTEMLSKEAALWLEEEPDLGQVVRNLKDLAGQKKDLEESQDILTNLRAALGQPGTRNLFPPLRVAWLMSLELEIGLINLNSQILDWQQRFLKSTLSDADLAQLAALQSQRQQLDDKLRNAPESAIAYETRDKAIIQSLKEMERDLDEQLLRIEDYKKQVDAMIRVLREVKYKGSYNLQVRDEDEVRDELEKETKVLGQLYDQTLEIKLKVQRDMIVGSGGEQAARTEGDLRLLLRTAQNAEAVIYMEAARRSGRGDEQALQLSIQAQKTIALQFGRINDIRRLVDERAAMKVKHYRQVVEAEALQLTNNEADFAVTEVRSLKVARAMGTPLFIAANERLGRVVLEADLGLVDLAWRRKQEYTDQMEFFAQEQGRKVGFLKKLLDEASREVE